MTKVPYWVISTGENKSIHITYLDVECMVGPLDEVVSRSVHMINNCSEMKCSSFVVPTYDSLTYQSILTVADVLT